MCVFFHAPEGGTAVFYFVGGGRRRVPGLSTRLSTRPHLCAKRCMKRESSSDLDPFDFFCGDAR